MFKVGDRVRFISNVGEVRKGDIYVISKIIDDIIYLGGDITSGYHCAHVEKVSDSPVREVTRREIVPGVYGEVHVGNVRDGTVEIRLSDEPDSYYNAEELREAAHILNQLAEALRDG